MIIVDIKNNQSRSTESIYIQNLMYTILMENYQIDYKLLLPIIQCDKWASEVYYCKRKLSFLNLFLIGRNCSTMQCWLCVCVCQSLSLVQLFLTYGLQPTRLLCPQDFPNKHGGVDCYSLLHWILPTQGSNPGLPHCRQFLCCLSHQKSPQCWLGIS